MVLCFLLWPGVGVSVTIRLMCVHIILVRFGLLVATFWEMAAGSVGRVFSLCFGCLWFWVFPVLVLGLGFGSGCFGS